MEGLGLVCIGLCLKCSFGFEWLILKKYYCKVNSKNM